MCADLPGSYSIRRTVCSPGFDLSKSTILILLRCPPPTPRTVRRPWWFLPPFARFATVRPRSGPPLCRCGFNAVRTHRNEGVRGLKVLNCRSFRTYGETFSELTPMRAKMDWPALRFSASFRRSFCAARRSRREMGPRSAAACSDAHKTDGEEGGEGTEVDKGKGPLLTPTTTCEEDASLAAVAAVPLSVRTPLPAVALPNVCLGESTAPDVAACLSVACHIASVVWSSPFVAIGSLEGRISKMVSRAFAHAWPPFFWLCDSLRADRSRRKGDHNPLHDRKRKIQICQGHRERRRK